MLKVNSNGEPYHTAVPGARDDTGSILTVIQRFGGGFPIEEAPMESLVPRDPTHRIVFAIAYPR